MAKKPTKSNLPKAKGKQPVPQNKTGGASGLEEGIDLDDVILNFYDCGAFGWVGVTDAEKEVLEQVGINDGMMNYTLDFEFAYDMINTVI